MLDVAAVAESIVLRESLHTREWIASAFGLSVDSTPRWLAVFAGLHDFGKAIPGFQCKWPEGQSEDESAGLSFLPEPALRANRHDWASAALLRPEFIKRFPGMGWAAALSQALGAHHGYFPTSREIKGEFGRPMFEDATWATVRAELISAYFDALQPGEPPIREDAPLYALAWLAGLTSVADWIGSNQEWFPSGERGESLAEHHAKARLLAEHALDAIGWPSHRLLLREATPTNALLGRILNRVKIDARPLQFAADHLLSGASGPVLMIVEAPMGEGKTELAFLAHLRLQSANGHRGLYVALPTQATGNAMFDRALTFLHGFAPDTRLDIQLAHGGAMLDERLHRLRGIDDSVSESVASSAWLSQRKRPLLSPYGVGTIDQALFAVLNVKHHFVRLWGLANRVVVLDEVHAYDTYTSGLIEALLRWLKAMNCSVVLMSATLPAQRRAAFLKAWGGEDTLDIAYPRLVQVCNGKVSGEHVACRALDPISVSGIDEDLSSLASVALQKLAAEGCGVVIVNTVQRAQELYIGLKGQLGAEADLMLFHARFPADERGMRERAVLEKFGRDAVRPRRALLIATQVVEQSLDIDFDFMISDLAPVDLLLQRAGRLHRHQRERPEAHRVPCLIVAGFEQDRLPELTKTAWGYVYDPYVLYRTWAIAGTATTWTLPSDIDRLVQAVYGQEDVVDLRPQMNEDMIALLDKAYGVSRALFQDQSQQAKNAAIDCDQEVQNAYTGKPRGNEEGDGFEGLKAVTRLGEEGITVVPILLGDDGWRLFAEDEPFDPRIEVTHELAKRIYGRQLRVSRKDIVNGLLEQEQSTVSAFDSHPLLRNLYPLRLKNGAAEFDRIRVRLDPELGLTYESLNKEDA
jgi:CRISPR-associated endonuclease/helicase Cas3